MRIPSTSGVRNTISISLNYGLFGVFKKEKEETFEEVIVNFFSKFNKNCKFTSLIISTYLSHNKHEEHYTTHYNKIAQNQ